MAVKLTTEQKIRILSHPSIIALIDSLISSILAKLSKKQINSDYGENLILKDVLRLQINDLLLRKVNTATFDKGMIYRDILKLSYNLSKLDLSTTHTTDIINKIKDKPCQS